MDGKISKIVIIQLYYPNFIFIKDGLLLGQVQEEAFPEFFLSQVQAVPKTAEMGSGQHEC